MSRRASSSIALALLLACACVKPPLIKGGDNGPMSRGDVEHIITALRAYDVTYPPPPPGSKSSSDVPSAKDFLHLFFANAYDDRLVDVVYFVDVANWASVPTIHTALTQGEKRPHVTAEEQNVWAVVMIAAPKQDCFVVNVNHETIVPVESRTELGIFAAIALLTHISSSSDAAKATGKHVTLAIPNQQCKQAGPSKPAANVGDDSKKDKDDAAPASGSPLRFIGEDAHGRYLYAGLVKLDVNPGSTNRVVVSVQRVPVDNEPNDPDVDRRIEPTTSAVVTFRNALRPRFAATIGLGSRFELQNEYTTNGLTELYHFYDPDLFVMAHWLPGWPHADYQLEHEWYPSLFVGTNLLAQSPLNDLVAGARIPLWVKSGVDVGLDWSKYSYNTVPSCTSNCVVHSRRHYGLFLAFDYEL